MRMLELDQTEDSHFHVGFPGSAGLLGSKRRRGIVGPCGGAALRPAVLVAPSRSSGFSGVIDRHGTGARARHGSPRPALAKLSKTSHRIEI